MFLLYFPFFIKGEVDGLSFFLGWRWEDDGRYIGIGWIRWCSCGWCLLNWLVVFVVFKTGLWLWKRWRWRLSCCFNSGNGSCCCRADGRPTLLTIAGGLASTQAQVVIVGLNAGAVGLNFASGIVDCQCFNC